MQHGFRVIENIERADPAMVASFASIPAAIISDNMNRMFAGGPTLRPMHRGGGLAGTALTVRTHPGDNLMIHKAADIAQSGDVIVVDGGGDLTNSLIGELIVAYARSKGVVGFVVNGAIRDLDTLGAGNFPIYAAGVSHRGPYKDGPGEVNVPIALGGMVVEPGDIIIGDLDGVVAIPKRGADKILAAARTQQTKEAQILAAIEKGEWDRSWVDNILTSKGIGA